MMGDRRVPQGSLFYEFRLEEHVPTDHLIRAIDRFVACRASADISPPSTARSDDPRSIPS